MSEQPQLTGDVAAFRARSIEYFRKRERPNPDWIITGLLKRGNTAFMIGPPKKACKSWMLLDLAWTLSEGHPAWGIKKSNGDYLFTVPRAMRTVYFTQEDTEDDVHDRVNAHIATGRDVNDKLWIVPKNLGMAFDSQAGRDKIQAELDAVRETAGRIDLVIFDPLRRMHHGDENDSKVFADIWAVLDRIHKRYACSTIISHHVKKPPTGEARMYYDPSDPYEARGSGDIYGGGDAFMTIVPRELSKDTERPTRKLEMHFESKRGKPLPPAMLKVHMDTGGVEYMGTAWQRNKDEEDGKVDRL